MPLHADDLDPATRARLGLGPKRRTATTKREASNAGDDGNRWRCHACGTVFDRWSTAERHARDAGHHRTDLVVP